MKQLTHLKINNFGNDDEEKDIIGIDLFIEDKVNLEYLEMEGYRFKQTNFLTNGNLKNLTFLDVNNSSMKNQDFANLIVSPNLPKLTTLKANNLYHDETVATFPPNSQSSVTYLDIRYCELVLFPSLLDHCPKLKKLKVLPGGEDEYISLKELLNMMKSPSLSNLEYLDITCCGETVEIIFTSPIYSNLQELRLELHESSNQTLDISLVSKCTTLVNLKTLDLWRTEYLAELEEEIKRNPTFSKVKNLKVPKPKNLKKCGKSFGRSY
ncbi:predicted protein [Naegleria gruberi]|uniref:Predicted protein n=1 Tax=Naegleria gruberi TaxID=5762 RepID=D2W3D5_NAEGR|nr:uncharacterized protein NAEGRDRAFT_75907 [Naegleria gruberi]EFC36397.1 predicted protein [Naegleria gruberi]|eukprot:XP_002669141.1 predicted protein [Naegleria gruberi strain NEG-M]